MRAAWYEKQGPAREVLTVGEMPDPAPGRGELRIRISASGINPGDIRKRQDDFGYGMAYPRVIPHSDGAGRVDEVGEGVSSEWLGKSVWCYGAQSYRPFGTASEFTIVPAPQAVLLPANVPMEQGACLGIPGITGHRAVHVAGSVSGRWVLVQGAAGSVGLCAVQLARRSGAHEVLLNDAELPIKVKALAPEGIDHIVEVAFAANIERDVELLKMGGSIAAYATNAATPTIPFWQLVFKNIQLFFLGSDDFAPEVKAAAARDINAALEAGWPGFAIGERIPISDIIRAHELAEHPLHRGRIVVTL
jgi:NADPH2:quinone reductase